jgi:hypothetical protein
MMAKSYNTDVEVAIEVTFELHKDMPSDVAAKKDFIDVAAYMQRLAPLLKKAN